MTKACEDRTSGTFLFRRAPGLSTLWQTNKKRNWCSRGSTELAIGTIMRNLRCTPRRIRATHSFSFLMGSFVRRNQKVIRKIISKTLTTFIIFCYFFILTFTMQLRHFFRLNRYADVKIHRPFIEFMEKKCFRTFYTKLSRFVKTFPHSYDFVYLLSNLNSELWT